MQLLLHRYVAILRQSRLPSSLDLPRIPSLRVPHTVLHSNWQGGTVVVRDPSAHMNVLSTLPVTEACRALPGFQPTLTGGNGNSVQVCPSHSYLILSTCTELIKLVSPKFSLAIGRRNTLLSLLTKAPIPRNCVLHHKFWFSFHRLTSPNDQFVSHD